MMNLEQAAVEKDQSGNAINEEFDGLKNAKLKDEKSEDNNVNEEINQPLINEKEIEETVFFKLYKFYRKKRIYQVNKNLCVAILFRILNNLDIYILFTLYFF